MGAFIASQLKYPKEALDKKIEGVVLVKYDIDYKGKVVDAKVSKSLGYGCDEEAVRIVKLFEFEIPKGPRKLRVLFHQKAKIYYKLPKLPWPSAIIMFLLLSQKKRKPQQRKSRATP